MRFLLIALAFAVAAAQQPTSEVVCEAGAIDLVIVLDESGSIGASNFKKALDACAQLANSLEIGPKAGQSNVGFVLFNNVGHLVFKLTDFLTNEAVEEAIRKVAYSQGGTNIASGMSVAISEVFTARSANRSSVPKVMIVLTDGQDGSNVAAQHNLALQANITTFGLGIGSGVDMNEMIALAGDKEHVFSIEDFSQLAEVMDQICKTIESSVAPPVPTLGHECNANPLLAMLDIVLIVDTSSYVDGLDFYVMQGAIVTFVYSLWVGQDKNARVSIIAAAGQPTVLSDLEKHDNNGDMAYDLNLLKYDGKSKLNPSAALIEAQRVIDETGGRKGVKTLVIFFASKGLRCQSSKVGGMQEKTMQEACSIAAQMVADPYTELMTIAIRQGFGDYPDLDFGSPCYKIQNNDYLAYNLVNLACQASCFCNKGYSQVADGCHVLAECVKSKELTGTRTEAEKTCEAEGGFLADVHSEGKDSFLKEMAVNAEHLPYWIGLSKERGRYSFTEGANETATVITKADYTNWADKEPDAAAGNCVYVKQSKGFATKWFAGQCAAESEKYYYFCQRKACDFFHRC